MLSEILNNSVHWSNTSMVSLLSWQCCKISASTLWAHTGVRVGSYAAPGRKVGVEILTSPSKELPHKSLKHSTSSVLSSEVGRGV